MYSENSSNNRIKRGFGWIPDLPDVTDPDLSSILSSQTRVLTREGLENIEEIATMLVATLKDKEELINRKKLKDINKRLVGNTHFPNVQIYKILRVGALSQEKEIVQLRYALYLIYIRAQLNPCGLDIYKRLSDSFQKVKDKLPNELEAMKEPSTSFQEVNPELSKNSIKLFQWLQKTYFDDDLEKIVKAFQVGANLLNDGIVGLKTYTAIQAILSEDNKTSQEINLLCPSSLIPHDILNEVFQHLVYLWLCSKFRIQIDSAFQCFYSSHPLNPFQLERAHRARQELEALLCQQLKGISVLFRKSLKSFDYSVSANNYSSKQVIESSLIEKLASLELALIRKSEDLLKISSRNIIDNDFLKSSNLIHSDVLSDLQDLLREQLGQITADKTIFENSFIVRTDEEFTEQFHLWFHIVEPFVSAFFQVLSPLANYNNLKDAIRVGFERLDSCIQFHLPENISRVNVYKTLLEECSSIHLSEKIEDLQSSRCSVIDLLSQTLSKINRQHEEDLSFRGDIINALITLASSTRGGEFKKEEFLKMVQSNLTISDGNESWNEIIKPAAVRIFDAKTDVLKNGRFKLKEKIDLEKEKQDVKTYLCFFEFIKEILDQQYGINLNSTNDFPENKANLASFLSAKKELFEIVNSVSLEVNSNTSTAAGEDKSPFFEPITLQLPVNTDLVEQSSKFNSNSNAKSYFFLPGVVDLSYWCTPIEDQGVSNACTAFSGIALVEYFFQRHYGKYVNLSTQFLYKTARNLMNRFDDAGASVRQTMKALVLFGVPPEEVWPWKINGLDEEPPAFCYAYAQSYQTIKYFRLDASKITSKELLLFQIKAVLAAGLPCIFGFTVYSSFYKEKNIRRGHVPLPGERDQVVGGHAAVAIGYNDYKIIERVDGDPSKQGAILIRNSWGTSWGNGGYGWVPYEYILEGLTADWWSLLKSEWFDGGAFGLGAVDPGKPGPKPPDPPPPPRR